MVQSVYPLPDENSYANGFTTVHGSPLEQRWGGWWVTGDPGGAKHMGNVSVMYNDKGSKLRESDARAAVARRALRPEGISPAPYSDVVALLVHRASGQHDEPDHAHRMGSAAGRRNAEPDASARVTEAARDLVDYMLFVDEAPLVGPVKGTSGFAESFVARGPRDGTGPFAARVRSAPPAVQVSVQLHDLHAGVRCPSAGSQERGLLAPVGSAVRQGRAPRYKGLAPADRQAIISILRETKRDLPEYFKSVA